MERVVRREAHAKINVYLKVLGRRADGYHDIETLILPVSLADTLTVRFDAELRLTVKGERADAVPVDDTNLVMRAARALAGRAGIDLGADIEVEKRIPVGAGLGGGSADAAAALHALNELWACELDRTVLLDLAAGIGSDVPALVHGGAVKVRGRGEIVEPAPDVGVAGWFVLVPLSFQVSVADAYRWWDEEGRASDGLANDLEGPVARHFPAVSDALRRLEELGADRVRMSGSGPTVVGGARSEQHANELAAGIPGSIPVSAPA